MSSENEATRAILDDENRCNQVKTAELVAEVLQYEQFQEEVVRKINDSKKALYDEGKHVLRQAEKIKEIDASIAESSKALGQEMYGRWKFTQNLSDVRNLCQEVNTFSEKTDDVLNRCEPNILEYEKQVMTLEDILEERKAIIDGNLEAQRRKLNDLELDLEKDKVRYAKEKENLIQKITQCKQKRQTEIEASLKLRSTLGEAQERKEQIQTQIADITAENNSLQSRLLQQQDRKQRLLAKIENNRQNYKVRINEMRSTLEDKKNELQQVTEENETIEKQLEEQSNIKEKILSEIAEYSEGLDCYKQKCSEVETEGKQMQEKFAQNYNGATSKVHNLADCLRTAEQKCSDDKEVKSQLEAEVTVMIEEIQHGHVNIENLQAEILKLQSLNEIKTRELSEKKVSIDSKSASVIKISNELIDVTKKLNEREIEKSRAVMKITAKIHELEKQTEDVKATEDAKLKTLKEEMEGLKIKARDNILKQQERTKEIDKRLILADQLKKECDSVVNNTRQLENDLQGVSLEHDILLKKVEELEKSSSLKMGPKNAQILAKPRAYKKRDVDEMSDSSMEGTISVQEHLKRQKLRAHKPSVM